jgi:predicted ribosome quality control (RQC) complex YloA/Tae2 family protein
MALSATEIGSIVQELAPALTSGWIQKIAQPLPEVLLLEIRMPGHTHRLLCSVQDETARLHLVRHNLVRPPTPPPFCQLLRARIQGARIDAIHQVTDDRIVRLDLTSRDGPVSLIAELFGRNADLLLLDETQVVQATIRRNKDRLGQPYQAPLPMMIRPPSHDVCTPVPDNLSEAGAFPVSAKLEALFGEREAELSHRAQRTARESVLRKALKKHVRLRMALGHDLEQAARYEPYGRYGELLKMNLGAMKKGLQAITVVDYYDEALPQLTIPLDPTKDPQANMEAYFIKHRKFGTAQREIAPRLASIEAEVREIHVELEAIKNGTWQAPTADRPAAKHTGHRRARGEKGSLPFRRFVSSDGHQIFVGRNARENDTLTFGLAKSEDLWLHARGCPGSHVVVRLEKGIDPPLETLKDAAILALLYSDLKKSGRGEVMYTRRKWVRKAKGQAPGAVTVTQEKSLFVTLDKRRLDAMKDRSQPAS